MTTFDVHTDKALKELRARLDQAERERDEARQHARAAERDAVEAEARCAALTAERDEAGRAFRDLVAVLDRDGGQRQAGETIAGTLERATRLAADLVVGEAERVREAVASTWALMRCAIVDVLGMGSEEAIERQAMRLAMDPALTPDAAFRAAVRRAHEVVPSARGASPAPEAAPVAAERDAGEAERTEARHRELLRDLAAANTLAEERLVARNAEVAEVERLNAIIDGEAARIAAAEMARDLRWLVAMRECGFKIAQVAKLALDGVSDAGAAKIAEAATWGDDIAAAIRAARGAL